MSAVRAPLQDGIDKAGNKQVIERYYAELWNGWNLDLVDQIIASDIEFRGSIGTIVRGRSEFLEYILKIRTAFHDFHNAIKHLIAERDKVVAQMTYTGTHRGELFGMGGTGTKRNCCFHDRRWKDHVRLCARRHSIPETPDNCWSGFRVRATRSAPDTFVGEHGRRGMGRRPDVCF